MKIIIKSLSTTDKFPFGQHNGETLGQIKPTIMYDQLIAANNWLITILAFICVLIILGMINDYHNSK